MQSGQNHRGRKQISSCERLVGGVNGEKLLPEYRVLCWGDGNIPELDTDGGHTTLLRYLMPLNCSLYNSCFYVMSVPP